MKISLYDIPPSGISAGGDDDSGLLELFRQKATEYNRDWSITDPLREGAADIVRGFSPSNIENERLQSLVGLDDQQFIRAVQDGRVQRDEWPLGRMPQEQRDAILRGRIAQRLSLLHI